MADFTHYRIYCETEAEWVGGGGQDSVYALATDGTYVYAGLSTDPAQVVRIAIETMGTSAIWTGEEGEGECQALAFDGQYQYCPNRQRS